jgi:hypothetical protein
MIRPAARIRAFGICLLSLAALLPPRVLADPSSDLGTSWLKIPLSARSAAMAGAYSAVAEDAETVQVNPAGLAGIQGDQVTYMQSFWAQDVSVEDLAFAMPLSKDWGGAVMLDYLNFGQVDKVNIVNGQPVAAGNYSPSGLNVSTGIGCQAANGLQVGGVAKFLFQDIQTTSSATVAIDAGGLYSVKGTGLSFAGVVSNLGGTLDTDNLPLQLTLGAALRTSLNNEVCQNGSEAVHVHFITLSSQGDLSLYNTGFSNLRFGAEYWYRRQIALRVGYRFAPYGDLSGVTGLASGVGLCFDNWEFAYALTTQGDMGTTSQVSLSNYF